jgi:hypothetical protein
LKPDPEDKHDEGGNEPETMEFAHLRGSFQCEQSGLKT